MEKCNIFALYALIKDLIKTQMWFNELVGPYFVYSLVCGLLTDLVGKIKLQEA